MADITGAMVNELLAKVTEMIPITADPECGDKQLTLLAIALVTACRSCQVERETAIDHIERYWSETENVPLAPLPGAHRAN